MRAMTDLMVRLRLPKANPDSKIADLMILGNTKGMVKGLKNIHASDGRDGRVTTLSQKLIDTETNNIRQMRPFL